MLKKVVVAWIIEKPEVSETNPTKEQIKNLIAWTEINFIYKNLILNGLTIELYGYYTTISTSKEV